MWILWVWTTAASAAGCKGAIGHAVAAWGEIAVPIPTGEGTLPALTDALDTVTTHSAIADRLRASRSRKERSTLPTAVAEARAWLDRNPNATAVPTARAALDAAEAACGS